MMLTINMGGVILFFLILKIFSPCSKSNISILKCNGFDYISNESNLYFNLNWLQIPYWHAKNMALRFEILFSMGPSHLQSVTITLPINVGR